jgi:hypothetical protein
MEGTWAIGARNVAEDAELIFPQGSVRDSTAQLTTPRAGDEDSPRAKASTQNVNCLPTRWDFPM